MPKTQSCSKHFEPCSVQYGHITLQIIYLSRIFHIVDLRSCQFHDLSVRYTIYKPIISTGGGEFKIVAPRFSLSKADRADCARLTSPAARRRPARSVRPAGGLHSTHVSCCSEETCSLCPASWRTALDSRLLLLGGDLLALSGQLADCTRLTSPAARRRPARSVRPAGGPLSTHVSCCSEETCSLWPASWRTALDSRLLLLGGDLLALSGQLADRSRLTSPAARRRPARSGRPAGGRAPALSAATPSSPWPPVHGRGPSPPASRPSPPPAAAQTAISLEARDAGEGLYDYIVSTRMIWVLVELLRSSFEDWDLC